MPLSPADFRSLCLTGRYVDLLPMEPAHAEALVQAASAGRSTYTFTSVPSSLDEAQTYIATAIAARAERAAVPFVIYDRATASIVGSTRLAQLEYWEWPSAHRRRDELPDALEIGWTWLHPRHQRTGCNTDCKLLLLRHAFETWQVRRVTFRTDARNLRSRCNIVRVGARLDGVLRANMPAYDGAVRDTAFYSLLLEEWPAAKAALTARLR